ncbi:alpha/beta fold hydrolase [Acidimangrovimonas sediminis]|uniref:alpha/beta fold hydrolase n=1 Tax=Acidimangrovimonas sediminis TaxID=2056283 RepID=UPI0011AFB09F|nr:alpha/beta hydrolase [Acidimangrovimonas sediminis]
MSRVPPRGRGSQFVETLISVLPRSHALNLPPEEELLTRPERESESERFFHRHFARSGFPVNLYDTGGLRQIEPFLPDQEAGFPATLLMPRHSASGCAFVVAEGRLYFLYDRIEQWDDAPQHLAFVAVQIGPGGLPGLSAIAPQGPDLSNSEYQLLAQLLAGRNLKAAAAALGASYDTKRKQVQVVLDKFGADSQTALLRGLTLEITAMVMDGLLPTLQRRPEAALVKRQFGGDVVVNTITAGDDLDLPIWEFGARHGRPILYFHNMLTPLVFRDDMAEVLRRNGLRWLVVPRHFLDGAGMPGDSDRRMTRLMRALADTVDYLAEAPVICLGESAGVSWAIHFARHNPGLVDHLMLTATPQPMAMPGAEHRPTIYAEISDKLRRDVRVTAGLARVYNALARVPTLARKGLRHLYRHSPPDLATVEEMCAQPHFFDWLRLIANVATRSSMDEIRGLQRNWVADLRALDGDVTFIHGAEDTISPADEIETLAASLPGAEFLRIENAGHFVMSQHFPALAAHVAALPGRRATDS